MNLPALIQANPLGYALAVAGAAWLLSTYGAKWWADLQAAVAAPAVASSHLDAFAAVTEANRVCHAAGLHEVCADLRNAMAKIPCPTKEASSA